MLRFAFCAIVFLIIVIATLLVMMFLLIVSLFDKKAAGDMAQGWLRIVCRLLLLSTGSKMTVIGSDRVPKDEPVLFVSNHRSMFDIVVAYACTDKRFGFVAKNDLEHTPVIGTSIRLTGGLFLDRKDIRKGMQMILEAIQRIKSGLSMWICPEGTRSKGEITELLKFKDGSFKIATKSGAKIVPVAMTGTGELLELSFPRLVSQHIVIEYGTPVDPVELPEETKKHMGDYFADIIRTMLKKNVELKMPERDR